jgi:CRISPR/Cas system-associated endoribonuclease Cas2
VRSDASSGVSEDRDSVLIYKTKKKRKKKNANMGLARKDSSVKH